MKHLERERALELRSQQWTYQEIAKELKVSKGILSKWLRQIPHIPSRESVDRMYLARIRNAQVLRRQKVTRVALVSGHAKREVVLLGPSELRIVGAMAYWAEGSKTIDSIVKFTNTDPDLVLLMVKWLKEICLVSPEKLRFHLRLHPGEDVSRLEKFWSDLTGIPKSQFYQTTLKQSQSGGQTGRKLKYGIASVVVCDTNLFYRIQGWIDAIKAGFTIQQLPQIPPNNRSLPL